MVTLSSVWSDFKNILRLDKPLSIFKAMANIRTVKNITDKGGNAYITPDGQDVDIPIRDNIGGLRINEDVTGEEVGSFITHSVQDVVRAPMTDPPDVVLKGKQSLPMNDHNTDLAEPRDIAYYPAGRNSHGGGEGKKPNIEAIREWVTNTKVGNASNITLSEEFGEEFGFIGWGFSEKELDKAIDEVAFKVARKIWYVGRKPVSLTDMEWQEQTKDMRPSEGSFAKNEKWVNGFPYGETYKYESGKLR